MGRLKQVAGLALLGALLSCSNSMYGSGGSGGYGSGGSCTPTATQVCMVNTSFSPSSRTVSVGTTVTWINGDGFTHTTTSSSVPAGASSWDISVAGGSSTSVMFTVAGTYQYHCSIHGAAGTGTNPGTGMHGTIVVN